MYNTDKIFLTPVLMAELQTSHPCHRVQVADILSKAYNCMVVMLVASTEASDVH